MIVPLNARAMMLTLMSTIGLGLGVGCGHTHTVGDGTANVSDQANETPPKDQKRSTAATEQKRVPGGTGAIKSDTRQGAPLLATSPVGLLKPHALADIQEKLVSNGRLSRDHESGKLDEPTRQALREFQRSKNLPATGVPDDLTIQKLGLEAGNIFRASQDDGAGQSPDRK